MSVDRELCAAYREGLGNKIVAANARIDAEHSRIDIVDAKVDSLKHNEFEHLKKDLEVVRKERREPLGWKERIQFIGIAVVAATAMIVAYVGYLTK